MQDKIQKTQAMLDTFDEQFKTVILSTLTEDQTPFASYAPYVKYNNDYYFIISKLALHYTNMLNHPKASIMFIADESATNSMFFRKRLSYMVDVELEIDDEVIKNLFIEKFGALVKQLLQMDFLIGKCHLRSGHFIVGPAGAYEVDGQQKVVELMTGNKGMGHPNMK